jgi:hypothetical protein
MAEPTRVPIEPGIIARVAAGIRYAVTGDTAWFGPMTPIPPMAGKPGDGTTGRAFDYPVGFNTRITPRGEELVSFAQMRALADRYDLLRLVIETRKDQFGKLKGSPKRRDGGEHDASVDAAAAFLAFPDGEHCFDDWLRMLIEEMLVIDAATIYPRANLGGGLYALELVDGATIKRVIDATGRTPVAPDPAYQQILKGVPAVDYTREELIYRPRNVRVSRLYGYSPVEQIIITVNIALRRQANQLSYYTDGNTPDLIFSTPEGWNPDQIAVFQTYWDSLVGDGQNKHLAKFVPHGVAPFDTKAAAMKDEFDEWLARVVCFALSVSPQPFVKQMNRATAESSHQQALEEGIAPLQRWVKSVLDQCLQGPMGFAELEWTWDEEESVDPLVAAQIDQILVGNKPVITVDEARAGRGLPPLTAAQREELTPAPPPMLPAPGEDKPPTPAAEGKTAFVKKKSTAHHRKAARQDAIDATAEPLGKAIAKFLAAQAVIVAKALGKALSLGKAADYDPKADDAVEGIEFDWAPLVKIIKPGLATIAVDAGGQALDEIGLFSDEVKAAVTAEAGKAAADRAAEMVGMKWDDAKLVPNPDAKWRIDEATRDMIRETTTTAIKEGWSNKELADNLIGDTYAFSPERAMNIARTETANAQIQGTIAGWRGSNSVIGKQWSAAPDCCDECQAYDGLIVGLDEEFPEGDPTLHPSCLPGDVLVSAASITAVSQRWYDGDIIIIDTASNKRLTSTPNHPVLTSRGWVAAGLLNIGGDVISSGLGQWLGAVSSNDKNMPARIEDVAKSFRRSHKVTARPVPVSAEDFHGDGEGSQIAVIWTNGLLSDNTNPPTCKHCGEIYFPVRDVELPGHNGSGVFDLSLDGNFPSNSGFMGGENLCSTLLKAHAAPLKPLGGALIAPSDASFAQTKAHASAFDAEMLGDDIFRGSADIHCNDSSVINGGAATADQSAGRLDRAQNHVPRDTGIASDIVDAAALDIFCDAIVGVSRISFAGHVYNLETNEGYYVAQGVVTHNCRCDLDAVLTPDDDEQESE